MSKLESVMKKLSNVGLLSEELLGYGTIPTGSYALNRVVSGKYSEGYPIGAITEIYGESSVGKTVFLTHAFKEAQANNRAYTALIDNEMAYSKGFAEMLGVDSSKLIYAQPDTLEECFKAMEDIIYGIRKEDKETPIIIGYDSIGVSIPKKELDGDYGDDPNMGGAIRAKLAGRCLAKLNTIIRKEKVAIIVINQVRSKVGVMYGDPTTTAGGGKALPFYASVSMKAISNKTSDVIRDDNKNVLGIKGRLANKKNKISLPFQECGFELIFDEGLNPYYGLAEWLHRDGVLLKADNEKKYSLNPEYSETGLEEKFYAREVPTLVANLPKVRAMLDAG